MTACTYEKPIAVLASGGLDSCILVSHLLAAGHQVHPLYVRTDTIWSEPEERALRAFLRRCRCDRLQELVALDVPLADVYQTHWSMTGVAVPDCESPDEAVYLPGRNAILLVKPAIWCQLNGVDQLVLASLSTSPFADAGRDFFDNVEAMVSACGPMQMQIGSPFETLSKRQVMELGTDLPLELTFSCLAPSDGLHCGVCNKCGERRAAFASVGRRDATPYAARTSLASYASFYAHRP